MAEFDFYPLAEDTLPTFSEFADNVTNKLSSENRKTVSESNCF